MLKRIQGLASVGVAAALGAWVWGGAICSAYPQAHGPFEPGAGPSRVQLRKCILIHEQQGGVGARFTMGTKGYALAKEPSAPLVRLEKAGEVWAIDVLDPKGTPLLERPTTNDMPGFLAGVFGADLNRDGKADFVVNIGSGGCGLAAAGSMTTFLLSEGMKYRATNFYSYHFGPEDLVTFKAKGPSYFIWNNVANAGEELNADDRRHNFWVYQLFRIEGGRFVQASAEQAGFPKWIWYSFKENHRETDLITPDQKKRYLPRP